ncbi:MAG: T9SS type A sorting domain-containing protein [Bacteroidetes bacterium]|nr:T9SS type A sorting domain-containing protein [Bacteroidota bacterium]
MKKQLLFFIMFLTASTLFAANWGLYDADRSWITLNVKAVSEPYTLWNSGTGSFQNHNFGTFTSDEVFTITAFDVKTWKSSGGNVTGCEYYYIIYQTGARPGSPTFTSLGGDFISDLGSGNQKWGRTGISINLLSGLASGGNYTLEIYGRVSGTGDPYGYLYDNNNGNSSNYSATFSFRKVITSSGDGNWSDITKWNNGAVPNSFDNVTINNAIIIDNTAGCNNISINTSKSLTINAGNSLTVSGAFSNLGTVTLKSPAGPGAPGSLITNGSVSGNIVAERYIGAYTSATDGWHLISSPVNNMAILGSNLAPGSNDDLYKYDEVNNLWLNYKVGANGITNFTNGDGFLCAYQSSATKSFTGVPNIDDITFTNLSLTAARGWHLLGNPYPSAIKWNDGNWTLTNVITTAKVLNSGQTYTDRFANDIIPAMQGFFVQVTSATNTVKIPKLARTHDATSFYKESLIQPERLMLTAQSDDNNTYVESVVRFDPLASVQFDDNYDSHFLQGIAEAPQMYSVVENDEHLSTNSLPPSSLVLVPVNFIKGISGNYTLTATGIESFSSGVTIFLEDMKTGTTQNLIQNPVYPFTSLAADDPSRFKLHFGGSVSVGDKANEKPVKIYCSGQTLYINNSSANPVTGQVVIYNLLGQALKSQRLDENPVTRINMSGATGYYLVKVITGNQTYTGKVFLN